MAIIYLVDSEGVVIQSEVVRPKQPVGLYRAGVFDSLTLKRIRFGRWRRARASASDGCVEVRQIGQSLFVTNQGFYRPVMLVSVKLEPRTPYTWESDQDLHIDDAFIMRWETPQRPQLLPLDLILVGLTALMVAVTCIALFTVINRPEHSRTVRSSDSSPESVLSMPITITRAPSPFPTIQDLTSPEPTLALADRRDVAPGSQPDLAAAATARVDVTPTPAPCVVQSQAPARIDSQLNIEITPVCVRPGEPYWRLAEAKWLNGSDFDGYHHLFVDIVDERRDRIYGASFAMRWQTGVCRRYIRGLSSPIDHGEHCVMHASGPAYAAEAEGLPSEIVNGIGLGMIEPEPGETLYLASYYLLFQKTTAIAE